MTLSLVQTRRWRDLAWALLAALGVVLLPALVKLLDNEDISNAQLCRYVKGPDFPTGGQILNSADELREIYKTGSGSIRLRAGSGRVRNPGIPVAARRTGRPKPARRRSN